MEKTLSLITLIYNESDIVKLHTRNSKHVAKYTNINESKIYKFVCGDKMLKKAILYNIN